MTYAIVPAGGLGARMGSRRPKQYLRLGRVPILVATLRALGRARGLDGIVVAVPEAHVKATRRLLAGLRVPKILDVVAGGVDRQESVWRALQRVPESARWIVVHDAVRPFITGTLVEQVRAAAAQGAATCGVPVRETVKRVKDGSVEATV
ncbi:MAG: IspD/TarI family cytidylyltransferase, partial [Candidatus Rokuibacteriota bacterium]